MLEWLLVHGSLIAFFILARIEWGTLHPFTQSLAAQIFDTAIVTACHSGQGGTGGKTPAHAVFKGLAIANTKAGPELFASAVANGVADIRAQLGAAP